MIEAEDNFILFLKYINTFLNRKPEVIIEIGARDCRETLAFNSYFPNAEIFAFECNPNTLPFCRQAIKGIKNIELIEKGVCLNNDKVTFYPINKEKTLTTWKDGNQGASSLLKASGKYKVETYVQNEITVDAIRLDKFISLKNISNIDVLWMDIQGGELMALQSLGNDINKVSIIHTEVEFLEIYQDQPLYNDIQKFLKHNGFAFCGFTSKSQYFADAVFVNDKLLTILEKLKYKFINKIERNIKWNN